MDLDQAFVRHMFEALVAGPPLGGWVLQARCGDLDQHQVRRLLDRPPMAARRREAEAMCAACPVLRQCADYAAAAGVWGFWGGTWWDGKPQGDRGRERAA